MPVDGRDAELIFHAEEGPAGAIEELVGLALDARQLGDHPLDPRHLAAREASLDQLAELVDDALGVLAGDDHPSRQAAHGLGQGVG